MTQALRVLLVEDSVDDTELLIRQLRLGGYDPTWLQVQTAETMLAALADPWDIIIADYTIPGFGALPALTLTQTHAPNTPLIIVSGTVGEETAVTAIKAGAYDYIVKGRWLRFIPAVARAITEAQMRRERQHVEDELKANARNLTLLNEITQAASGMLDFNQMLQVLTERLGELLNADGCYISLWDEKQQKPIPAAAYGPLRSIYTQVEVKPNEPTLTAHVLKSGQIIAVEDTQTSPHLSPRLDSLFPSRAILALPLIVSEQKLGAALISFNQTHTFTPDEIKRGEQASGQIALAIAKAQLLDSERKQRQLAETLREITHTLTNSLEPAEVLEIILDQLARVVTYDSASLYQLADQEIHQLASRTIYEQTSNPILTIKQFPHIEEVLTTHKPVIINDTNESPHWHKLAAKAYTRCWLGVPLIAHNEIIGMLNITHSRAYFYNQQDAEIALAFANQAATAIENARLYERLRHYAQDLERQVAERTQALAEANEQLKELDRLKTKFVSDVSHELRTPITNLKLYLNLLDRGDPQKRDRYLAVINQQTDRLEMLIRDILDISRLEADVDRVVFLPVNFNELIDRAIALHRQRAELMGLDLNFWPGHLLPLISGDASKLQQVAENLIANAIQYTSSGKIDVFTYADTEQQMICLQVTDTGMGVSAKEIPLLFDRFYRGETTSQSNIPGTGLGLSIVKEIVTLHNGRIDIESELNKGTTFRVWLPLSHTSQEKNNDETTNMV